MSPGSYTVNNCWTRIAYFHTTLSLGLQSSTYLVTGFTHFNFTSSPGSHSASNMVTGIAYYMLHCHQDHYFIAGITNFKLHCHQDQTMYIIFGQGLLFFHTTLSSESLISNYFITGITNFNLPCHQDHTNVNYLWIKDHLFSCYIVSRITIYLVTRIIHTSAMQFIQYLDSCRVYIEVLSGQRNVEDPNQISYHDRFSEMLSVDRLHLLDKPGF